MRNGGTGGVSVCTVVGIVFIILKLVGVIDWSWVWILCPFWLPIVFLLVLCFIVFIREKLDDIFHP